GGGGGTDTDGHGGAVPQAEGERLADGAEHARQDPGGLTGGGTGQQALEHRSRTVRPIVPGRPAAVNAAPAPPPASRAFTRAGLRCSMGRWGNPASKPSWKRTTPRSTGTSCA